MLGEGEAEDVVGFGEVLGAGGLDGAAGGGFRTRIVGLHEAGGGEVEPGIGVIGGVEGDDFGGVALDGSPILGAEREDGELEAGRGVAGVEGDGFLEAGDGVLVFVQFFLDESSEVDGLDVFVVEIDGAVQVLESVAELLVLYVFRRLVFEFGRFGWSSEGGEADGAGA